METIEYRTHDKSQWGDGEWQDEPDKKQWGDEETGYPCLIVRNRLGALCGYVGIPRSHPAYKLFYDGCTAKQAKERMRQWRKESRRRAKTNDYKFGKSRSRRYPKCTVIPGIGEAINRIEVHGGLTFADSCQLGAEESRGICHKTCDDDRVWWFGFDCAHAWDLVPGMAAYRSAAGLGGIGDDHETYKSLEYVTREVESLARQLKAMVA